MMAVETFVGGRAIDENCFSERRAERKGCHLVRQGISPAFTTRRFFFFGWLYSSHAANFIFWF